MGRSAVKFLLLSSAICRGRDGFDPWPLLIAEREIGAMEIHHSLR